MSFLLILFLSFSSCAEIFSNTDNNNQNNNGGDHSELIGKTLPDWQEGYLDIHAINTGRGECMLYIFPDGTTMLEDAAGSLLEATADIPPTLPKPYGAISSGQVITNYVMHFIKATSSNKLNYLLLSHFHPDHMGSYVTNLPMAPSGNFRMGGITEVGAKIPFETIIDRGYPGYDYPTDLKSTDLISNYIKFVNWAKTAYNATAEQFGTGKNDQIVLRRNLSKYDNFQVRNIVANGKVWTGSGTESANTLPPAEELEMADPDENIFSVGFHLSYGKFNYFCGGDLQYNDKTAYPWKDIEAPVANVMTAVDAMKANHHGTKNCNGAALLNKLVPQVVLIQPWRDVQPNLETIERFYAANNSCSIFLTNLTQLNQERLFTYLAKFKSLQGHIVLRVEPGGAHFSVYTLDDSNEEYKVKKILGPYTSN